MKYVCVFFLCLIFSGCEIKQDIERKKLEIDSATISESFYLVTVLHDNHLFIIRQNCGILHHPDCPCFKSTKDEKTDAEPKAPIIFLNPFNPVK